MLKIKTTAFTSLNTQEFPTKYSEIVSAILDNPGVFSNLPVPQATLENSVTLMTETTNKASNGGSQLDRDARDTQRAICTDYLFKLASFVANLANQKSTQQDGITLVNASKFTLAKVNYTPAPPVQQVANVHGEWTKNGGTAEIEWDKSTDGVIFYSIEKTMTDPADNNANWTVAAQTSRTRVVLTDLPRLSRVWVRVVAYGKNGTAAAPSDPAMVTIG